MDLKKLKKRCELELPPNYTATISYYTELEIALKKATNDRKPVNELIKKYEGWLDFAVKKHSLPSFQNIVTMIIKDLKGLAL